MKIALAHDSFTQMGGAERVIAVLHEIFPQAPVFTLVLDKKFQKRYEDWHIKVSNLQYVYNIYPNFQCWLFLIPWAVSKLDLNSVDVLISTSSGFIKNIKLPGKCVHINYCHTPTRFLWIDKDYVKKEVPFLLRFLVKVFLEWMKRWDLKGAQRVSYFIANSMEVRDRVLNYYHRTSTVIYPPVDVDFWCKTREKQNYFLIAGRLQAHKKVDVIVEIFNELDLPLHVVGTGRQENYLKSLAKPNITFLGMVSDEQLRDEYSGALGLIYPQIEDFGLMPLEAAACGTATLGIAKGGNLETIIPGLTGEFFEEYNYDRIKQLILAWQPQKYKVQDLTSQAKQFSKEKFKQNLKNQISTILNVEF